MLAKYFGTQPRNVTSTSERWKQIMQVLHSFFDQVCRRYHLTSPLTVLCSTFSTTQRTQRTGSALDLLPLPTGSSVRTLHEASFSRFPQRYRHGEVLFFFLTVCVEGDTALSADSFHLSPTEAVPRCFERRRCYPEHLQLCGSRSARRIPPSILCSPITSHLDRKKKIDRVLLRWGLLRNVNMLFC
jgi:hypothetical protein